jgi:hypothetical protein
VIVLSGALVLVALVLLVFGAVDRNLPYVYASIGVSVLSLLLLLVGVLQRRGELIGDGEEDATTPVTDTSTERVPALVGAGPEPARAAQEDGDALTAELPAPVATPVPVQKEEPARAASRRVVPDQDEDLPPEPDSHEDWVDEPEDEGSGVTVLVVSGRPRYHVEGCRVLRGKEPQALDRDDARAHGFSSCGVCKPDADETAEQDPSDAAAPQTTDDGVSFTEALFGESLFTDPEASDESSALPDRPVQPVLPEVEPAPAPAAQRRGRPASELAVPRDDVAPPADLRGEDPADDPTREADDDMAVEPSPDVAANPDELAEASVAEPAAVAAKPDELAEAPVAETAAVADEPDGTADEPDDPAEDVPAAEPAVAGEPDDTAREPIVEPVAAADVPAAEPVADELPPDDVEAPAEAVRAEDAVEQVPAVVAEVPPSTEAPARRRRTGSKSPAQRASKAPSKPGQAGRSSAKRATQADAAGVPAAIPSAEQAPAKKAPAKKVPVERAPAKKAPGKAAAQKAAAEAAAAPAPEPQVKRPLVRTVRADALRLSAPSTGVMTTRVSARAAGPATSGSVLVVPDRDRFHRPECRFVRGVAGATTLPKASATRQGYAACGVCKP